MWIYQGASTRTAELDLDRRGKASGMIPIDAFAADGMIGKHRRSNFALKALYGLYAGRVVDIFVLRLQRF